MATYESKIKELFGNEEFAAKFKTVETPEKLEELFKEYGAELTPEEMENIFKAPIAEKKGEVELSADDLADVSGGIVGTALKALAFTWGYACDVWGGPQEAVIGTYNYWFGRR